jgi:hypothetical protein
MDMSHLNHKYIIRPLGRGTGGGGMGSPYEQGYADGLQGKPYDQIYDQPSEGIEAAEFDAGYKHGIEIYRNKNER